MVTLFYGSQDKVGEENYEKWTVKDLKRHISEVLSLSITTVTMTVYWLVKGNRRKLT